MEISSNLEGTHTDTQMDLQSGMKPNNTLQSKTHQLNHVREFSMQCPPAALWDILLLWLQETGCKVTDTLAIRFIALLQSSGIEGRCKKQKK